jgi:hypothetical protein
MDKVAALPKVYVWLFILSLGYLGVQMFLAVY